MPISFALISIVKKKKFDENFFLKLSIFEIDKFLQTLLRFEQWQERLAKTRQTEDSNLVWFRK
jgi:hypothetical protein